MKKQKTKKQLSPEEAKAVGSTLQKYNLNKAKKQLEIAKQIEENKKALGWQWIEKNKESRQVHPNKLEGYLASGYVLVSNA